MFKSNFRRALAGLALAGAAAGAPALLAGSANAATTSASPTATAQVIGGQLSFVSAPAPMTFPSVTLAGVDTSTSASELFDVSDATGSAAGWNITATSTQWSNGSGGTLPTSATTIASAPSATCDASSTCTVATTSVTYPYVLPAGSTAPTPTEMFNATAGTGMGAQSISPTLSVAIPANSLAGTYATTINVSLNTGP